jgi:hypothetical protein
VTLQVLKLFFNARLTLPSRHLIVSEGIKPSKKASHSGLDNAALPKRNALLPPQ